MNAAHRTNKPYSDQRAHAEKYLVRRMSRSFDMGLHLAPVGFHLGPFFGRCLRCVAQKRLIIVTHARIHPGVSRSP